MASITADPSILASKRAIYIGGLAEGVNPQILRAAMIPFGNIKSLDIPMDYTKGKHKGFGFVEFEDAEDATEAIFNMDGADIMGRSISVDMAQANQISKISNTRNQAIWSSDEWFQQHASGEMTAEDKEKRSRQQEDQVELRN